MKEKKVRCGNVIRDDSITKTIVQVLVKERGARGRRRTERLDNMRDVDRKTSR